MDETILENGLLIMMEELTDRVGDKDLAVGRWNAGVSEAMFWMQARCLLP